MINTLFSCYSLFRSLSPVFAGIVYSVSLTTGLGYPLDYHLIFVIMAGIILVVMVMVAGFPESIKQHKEQKRNETDTANGGGTQEQLEEPARTVVEDLTDQQNSARVDEKTAGEQREEQQQLQEIVVQDQQEETLTNPL